MPILQLNPTIPLDTPKGKAHAHVLIDYGEESHVLWLCFVDETGEAWTFRNTEVRLQKNETMRPVIGWPEPSRQGNALDTIKGQITELAAQSSEARHYPEYFCKRTLLPREAIVMALEELCAEKKAGRFDDGKWVIFK